jgi:argininosuccinate lyase
MATSTKVGGDTMDRFPAPVYSATVLAVNFEDATKYFLEALLEIHYAHTLMLAKQGIISAAEAAVCLRALGSLDRDAIRKVTYDGSSEDLFFYIEGRLSAGCDPEIIGKMHTARSRNDIDITLYRMGYRRELLGLVEGLVKVEQLLLHLAEKHVGTLIPAYTHTQPAQPSTLAHYLMAAVEFIGRDIRRLQAAFATVNKSPLGACAITTTGFPIDRHYTAELLGFEGLQVNSYGAIGSIDYVTEAASAVAVSMVNLGKLVQDLLLWCTKEYGFLRLRDAYVQISSIMPQKRNPVSLEHTRILASKAFVQAQGVLGCAHNTPFGDIVDSEDDLQPLVFSMFTDAKRALQLFAGVIENCEVQEQRLRQAANDNFLSVTELADTLVRDENLSFRAAHHLVSETVRAVGPVYDKDKMVDQLLAAAPRLIGRRLQVSRAKLSEALDPAHFVAVRTVVGGPGLSPISDAIRDAKEDVDDHQNWFQQKRGLLETYVRNLQSAAASWERE